MPLNQQTTQNHYLYKTMGFFLFYDQFLKNKKKKKQYTLPVNVLVEHEALENFPYYGDSIGDIRGLHCAFLKITFIQKK